MKRGTVGIRPEDMEDATIRPAQPGQALRAKVDITEALGSEVMVHFGIDAPQVFSEVRQGGSDGETLKAIGIESSATFVASFNSRSKVRPGDMIDIAVDTRHLHFFDPADGSRLTTALSPDLRP